MPNAPSPRDAQRIGQWTAFRKYADRDAVMFTPQAVWARDFLKDRKDPPKAIRWRPGAQLRLLRRADRGEHRSRGSGRTEARRLFHDRLAAHAAPAGAGSMTAADRSPGAAPVGRKPQVHRASCAARAPGAPIIPPPPLTAKQARTTPEDNGRGQSADKTLGWDWKVDEERRAHSASISGTARATRRSSTTTCRRPPDDRAVRLGAGHLPGDHRPAGLRADLRQPDPRARRRPTAGRWRSARR